MPFDEFNWVPAYQGAMKSVVTSTWHYIEHETLGAELYDHARDPQELSNVIASPAGSLIASQLADYLRTLGQERSKRGRSSP